MTECQHIRLTTGIHDCERTATETCDWCGLRVCEDHIEHRKKLHLCFRCEIEWRHREWRRMGMSI